MAVDFQNGSSVGNALDCVDSMSLHRDIVAYQKVALGSRATYSPGLQDALLCRDVTHSVDSI